MSWKFLDVAFNDYITFQDSNLFTICSMSRMLAVVTAILIAILQWPYLNIIRSPTLGVIPFSRMFALGFNPKAVAWMPLTKHFSFTCYLVDQRQSVVLNHHGNSTCCRLSSFSARFTC